MRFTTRCAGAHRDTEKAEEEIVGFRIRLPAERELRQCSSLLESTEQQGFSLVFSKPEAMWRMRAAGSAAARIRHISMFFLSRLRASRGFRLSGPAEAGKSGFPFPVRWTTF